MAVSSSFYKNKESDVVWWVDNPEETGTFQFSFDRKTVYDLFKDYYTLPPDKKAIFDKENPEWEKFFKPV